MFTVAGGNPWPLPDLMTALIGVRAGGARGAAAPPNFGQLRFFGQQEKIWAKPAFKDVFMFFLLVFWRDKYLHSHETVVAKHVVSFCL